MFGGQLSLVISARDTTYGTKQSSKSSVFLTRHLLVAVDVRGVDVPVAGPERGLHGGGDLPRLGLPGAEAELRHGGAGVQGHAHRDALHLLAGGGDTPPTLYLKYYFVVTKKYFSLNKTGCFRYLEVKAFVDT